MFGLAIRPKARAVEVDIADEFGREYDEVAESSADGKEPDGGVSQQRVGVFGGGIGRQTGPIPRDSGGW